MNKRYVTTALICLGTIVLVQFRSLVPPFALSAQFNAILMGLYDVALYTFVGLVVIGVVLTEVLRNLEPHVERLVSNLTQAFDTAVKNSTASVANEFGEATQEFRRVMKAGVATVADKFGETIETAVKDGTKSLSQNLSNAADAFERVLKGGVASVTTKVDEVLNGKFLRSQADVEKEISNDIPEHIMELVRHGKTDDALSEAKERGDRLAILVLSQSANDWRQAANELKTRGLKFPKYYSILAYKLWTAKEYTSAIEIAEHGLRLLEESKAPEDKLLIGRIKNSLAYYYAEARDPKLAERAFRYVTEAKCLLPNESVEVRDTEGYLNIVYGKTAEEVRQGVDAMYQSSKSKGRLDSRFFEALAVAGKRLSEFESNT